MNAEKLPKRLPDPRLLNMRRAQAYIGTMHRQIEPVITIYKIKDRTASWRIKFESDKAQKAEDAKQHRFFVLAFRLKYGIRSTAEEGQMQALKPATTAD